MERDPNIARLIREAGVVRAPDRFSEDVMKMIVTEPEKQGYEPLIKRRGRILIIISILVILAVTLLYSEPGGRLAEIKWQLPDIEWQLPQWNVSLDFLSNLDLSTGIVSGLVALFILVLSDAVIRRRKLV